MNSPAWSVDAPTDIAIWAQTYADLNMPVLPIEPAIPGDPNSGKRPLKDLHNGKDEATLDPDQITRWFANGYANRNLAISCGPANIVVLDADLPKEKNGNTDGVARLAELEAELGPLPESPTETTGSGALHRIFLAPEGMDLVGKVGRAIDVIRNGYIVVAPSKHYTGGKYTWRANLAPGEIKIAPLPEKWLEFLRRPEPAQRPTSSGTAIGEDFYEALGSLDQRSVLEHLSGSSIVNGERFAFKSMGRGKYNLFVDRGGGFEGTSNFIDSNGKIAARNTGKADGGPLASQWLRWYHDDDKAIRKGLTELVPELERFGRAKSSRPHTRAASSGDSREESDTPPPRDPPPQKPEMTISKDIRGMVDFAEEQLADLGDVYTRGRRLVHVVRDRSESHGLQLPDGTPVIAAIGRERLRELVNDAVTWIAVRKKNGESVREETVVPPVIPATLADRGEWIAIKPIEGVTDSPVLRPDGSVQDRYGYDRATKLIFTPTGASYPAVKVMPTRHDAELALAELTEPFNEFPFVAPSDRMAIVAIVLTLIGRAAIDGPTPMFAVRAPVPGSGKGLCLDAAAMIATGRAAPKRAAVTNDDELRKALFAYALEVPPIVVFDNAEGAIGSPVLAAALTTGTISDRMLGVSETRTASLRFVMAVTGNNLTFRGDLGRRVVPIDLDPRVEHAEDRTFRRAQPLLEYVRIHRPRLVVAALTILRAYYVAGRPPHGAPPKGSYEDWDRVVRGSIRFAGGADPLEGVQRIRLDGDDDLEKLRALLVAWDGVFGSKPTTIAEAIKHAGKEGALFDAFAVYCRSGSPESKPLAGAFRRLKGRIAGGRELLRDAEDRNGVVRWLTRLVES